MPRIHALRPPGTTAFDVKPGRQLDGAHHCFKGSVSVIAIQFLCTSKSVEWYDGINRSLAAVSTASTVVEDTVAGMVPMAVTATCNAAITSYQASLQLICILL